MKQPELEKKESQDSEELEVNCDSSCHIMYHLHNHFKKVQKFFKNLFQKLKLLLL